MLNAHLKIRRGELLVDAEFELPDALITVLRGDSGSGKTTVADMLCGRLLPEDGFVRLAGKVLFDSARKISLPLHERGIGYLFQNHRLLPHLTVEENIRLPVTHGGRRSRIAFEKLVGLLEIGPLLSRRPQTLSGGESQRAALGRALMGAENLLILDEPLSSVNPSLREKLMDLIRESTRLLGVPVLYITHSDRETIRLADSVLLLEEGRIRRASKDTLFTQP